MGPEDTPPTSKLDTDQRARNLVWQPDCTTSHRTWYRYLSCWTGDSGEKQPARSPPCSLLAPGAALLGPTAVPRQSVSIGHACVRNIGLAAPRPARMRRHVVRWPAAPRRRMSSAQARADPDASRPGPRRDGKSSHPAAGPDEALPIRGDGEDEILWGFTRHGACSSRQALGGKHISPRGKAAAASKSHRLGLVPRPLLWDSKPCGQLPLSAIEEASAPAEVGHGSRLRLRRRSAATTARVPVAPTVGADGYCDRLPRKDQSPPAQNWGSMRSGSQRHWYVLE
ncbi:hypothetical protein CDD83_8090 [Cordyceps sp. RAO-2017]|nr:hypothetical protein CDD83_8090 [Cordyceps sp. RAO-2017]